MRSSFPRLLRTLSIALCSGALALAAAAYPSKPITLLVPFSAGSATDVVAREFGKALSEVVKQPVIVDNRVGAEGTIGAQALMNAPADGHTMLFTSASLVVLDPLMKKRPAFDPIKDFAPVCGISMLDNTVNISGASPYRTLSQFIAAAKAQPDRFTYAYSTSSTRLAAELFAQTTGIKLRGIPYSSTVTGLTDVAAAQVDLFFIDHISAAPYRQTGKLRPLAVSGQQRLKTLPDVPSAKELGIPGYDVLPFNSVYLHHDTPPDLVNQMRQLVSQTMKTPAMQEMIDKRAMLPMPVCGESLTKFLLQEMDKMRQVIDRAGIERQ